jgi:hypothetical protein
MVLGNGLPSPKRHLKALHPKGVEDVKVRAVAKPNSNSTNIYTLSDTNDFDSY